MLVIPAVDILDGACVRLRGGDFSAATQYDSDPAAAARRFLDAGARRLHIVDLDAAKSGARKNSEAVRRIIAAAKEYNAKTQVGGGLRTRAAVEEVFAEGADFAVLGTAALRDDALREELVTAYPGKIIVGADSKNRRLAADGWTTDGGADEDEFFAKLENCPPAAVVRTDIGKDGMLAGTDSLEAANIAARMPCPLIVSGGVAGAEDIAALADASAAAAAKKNGGGEILGVIVGQAFYSGALTFADAIAAAETAQ